MMEGYKAFEDKNGELYCRDFHYEIGETYEMDGKPEICEKGFHFCKAIADCYNYYAKSDNTRICKVEALGDIDSENSGNKFCTNKIRIVEEITESYERRGNSNSTSTGFCNTGNRNTGNSNTGNRNTGNWNTGKRNTGNSNTGNWNTGNCNTGNRNTGNSNIGNSNTGNRNTGNRNTGNWNTGNWNTGNSNTGNRNTGNWNTGDWSTTDRSTGVFNTTEQKIVMFDKPSDWTFEDWIKSNARYILDEMPQAIKVVSWIWADDMTDEEKADNPTYETTGGFFKAEMLEADVQKWWNELSEDNKHEVLNLPNFDAEIFKQITGIEV